MEEGGDILVSAEHCMGRSLGKGEEHREGADWLVQSIACRGEEHKEGGGDRKVCVDHCV